MNHIVHTLEMLASSYPEEITDDIPAAEEMVIDVMTLLLEAHGTTRCNTRLNQISWYLGNDFEHRIDEMAEN